MKLKLRIVPQEAAPDYPETLEALGFPRLPSSPSIDPDRDWCSEVIFLNCPHNCLHTDVARHFWRQVHTRCDVEVIALRSGLAKEVEIEWEPA